MILPSAATPPAPSPQSALAAMKLSILPAKAHPIVAIVKTPRLAMNKGFLPIASDSLPSSGWNAVDVSKKAVDSQDAELAALKCDVMTGWDEAMRVPSKLAMNWETRIWAKMSQKRVGEDSPRKMKDFAVVEEVAEAELLRRGRRGERSVKGWFVSLSLYLMWMWLLLLLLRLFRVGRTPSSSSSSIWLILECVSESGPGSDWGPSRAIWRRAFVLMKICIKGSVSL